MSLAETPLARIRTALSAHTSDILAAGPFGSEEDDLDILVILKEPNVVVGERICTALRHAAPQALFYPTFRVESLLRASPLAQEQNVHLLLFPSLAVFRGVEREFVRYCIVRSVVPWIGDRQTLLRGERQRPKPNIAYYLNLLFETMQIFLLQSFSAQTSLNEAKKKLLYILKFSCLEVFYAEDRRIDLRHITATVFSPRLSPLSGRAAVLYHEVEDWNNPSRGRVMRAFGETVEILEQLSEAASHHGLRYT